VFEQLLATPLPEQSLKFNDVPNLLCKLFINLGRLTVKDMADEFSWLDGMSEKLAAHPLVAMAVVLARVFEKHPDAEEAARQVGFYFQSQNLANSD